MKRILCFLLLLVCLLTAFSLVSLADDNAQQGDGDTKDAVDGYGWYNSYQHLWKVSLYVGKSDQVSKNSNLSIDYYYVGNMSIYIKNSSWTVNPSVDFGMYNKVQYYNGYGLVKITSPKIISDANCPAVPIASGGNISTVKSYFGSTSTLATVLNAISNKIGTTNYGLVSSLTFTIGGQSRSGWPSDYLLPSSSMTNRVPWVIVYEPVIIAHMKDKVTELAFTATEFAIAQKNGWYNFRTDQFGPDPQRITRLTHQHLPTSVQLEESWFGYPVYNVTDDTTYWNDDDIVKGGGWGMRYLPVSIYEPTYNPGLDYGCYFSSYDTPEASNYGNVTVTWKNYKNVSGSVLCELYLDSNLIWSGYKSFAPYESITQTFSVYYSGIQTRTLTARINYVNRASETDPNDNMRQVNVTPVSSLYDFSVSGLAVNPSPVYQGNSVQVTFISDNWNLYVAYSQIAVEVLVGNTVVKTDYVDFDAYGRKYHSYNIPMSICGNQKITVRINWDNVLSESNTSNNSVYENVTVNPYYEFSIDGFFLSSYEVNAGGSVNVSCFTDSWDRYNAYSDILVEVLYDGIVVKTERLTYSAYARFYHTFTVNVGNIAGNHTIAVRLNWTDRNNEVNHLNNITTANITVKQVIDLRIEPVLPNSEYREGVTAISSYRVYNDSNIDVIPSNNNSLFFEVYYYNGGNMVVVKTMLWNQAAIPANESNLFYIKWTVPNIPGRTVYVRATVNATSTISEISYSNNAATFSKEIYPNTESQIPNTSFYDTKPLGFTIPRVTGETNGTAKWSRWEYVSNGFVKREYAIAIASDNPGITPDTDSPSAKKINGIWNMKSGYGITLNYDPRITGISGYFMPDAAAYTEVQHVNVLFPEFNYSTAAGKFRTLENLYGAYQFYTNSYASDNDRLHFTPLWYPDGEYIVCTVATECWTPAGMISSYKSSNTIIINGSAYDDWYIGR